MANPINIRFPPRRSFKGAFDTNQSTVDAIADDLRILLLSNFGERPVHHDFGANLRSIIFEQGPDVPQQVRDAISSAVEKWMPFVSILDIEVTDDTVNTTLRPNEIHVKINFSVSGIEGALSQKITA